MWYGVMEWEWWEVMRQGFFRSKNVSAVRFHRHRWCKADSWAWEMAL